MKGIEVDVNFKNMSRLSKFFLVLAGLTLVFIIMFFTSWEEVSSIFPSTIMRDLGGVGLLYVSLFLLFIFSSLGYYFSSYQSNIRNIDLTTEKKPVKIDWPFYMMVLGLLLPFIGPYLVTTEGFGTLIVLGFSFIVGIIFIVFGASLLFINRKRVGNMQTASERNGISPVFATLIIVIFVIFIFWYYF